jgi:hypothetical protein
VSQMQISRILSRILAGLRQQLTEEATVPSAAERRHDGLPGPHRGR